MAAMVHLGRSAHGSRRRLRMLAVVVAAWAASAGCVGQLGRNDDDVQPDSERPSVNHDVLVTTPPTQP